MVGSFEARAGRSGSIVVAAEGAGGGSGVGRSPAASAGSWSRLESAITSIPPACRASGSLSAGTTIASRPASRAASATARAPPTGRNEPLSESSPTRPRRGRRSQLSCPDAHNSATAIARSKPGPSLRRAPGARLATIRRSGNSKPQFTSAARTFSRSSLTTASGRPTIAKQGRPRWTSNSTLTGRASAPSTVNAWAVLNIVPASESCLSSP